MTILCAVLLSMAVVGVVTAAAEAAEVECPDCKGDGSSFVDRWQPGHGHWTQHYPCATCDATGLVAAPATEEE